MLPSIYAIAPFIVLLLMIATGPMLYPHFWHRYYPCIAGLFALGVVSYYIASLGNTHTPVHALAEYIQFITLIGALYMASSGILLRIHSQSTPLINLGLLWSGAILANAIGTTGASMLLIRPYMHLNRKKLAPYHVVFFIFMVSNVGGALTPIGDPPLFLGFLKGIPFFWPLTHCFTPWVIALMLLSLSFYYLDAYSKSPTNSLPSSFSLPKGEGKRLRIGPLEIVEPSNLILLAISIGAVFLDPNKLAWMQRSPYSITFHGQHISYLRELIFIIVGIIAYKRANKAVLAANEFSFEPLKEVVFIFIGIFGTMMPAMDLINHLVANNGKEMVSVHTLFWGTGMLSSILDNAPSYLSALTAALASKGLSINELSDVTSFLSNQSNTCLLQAISLAAVFFGAMTYVGNGPNFMVRSIAIAQGVQMPSFGRYIWRYALPFLLPVLFIIWGIFFWLLTL